MNRFDDDVPEMRGVQYLKKLERQKAEDAIKLVQKLIELGTVKVVKGVITPTPEYYNQENWKL